ncbi:MAG: hypothetical protein ABGX27_08945 [Desulfurobacteriaceae bacterium]
MKVFTTKPDNEYQEKLRRKELTKRMVKAAKRMKEDKEAIEDIKELEGTVGDGLSVKFDLIKRVEHEKTRSKE